MMAMLNIEIKKSWSVLGLYERVQVVRVVRVVRVPGREKSREEIWLARVRKRSGLGW